MAGDKKAPGMAGDTGRVVVAVVIGVGAIIVGAITGNIGVIAIGLVVALLGGIVLKVLG